MKNFNSFKFTPLSLRPRIWVDANQENGNVRNGEFLMMIKDKSGNANHATTWTSNIQYAAQLKRNVFNGNSAYFFSLGAVAYYFGDLSAQFPSEATIFMVYHSMQKTQCTIFTTLNNDTWSINPFGNFAGCFKTNRVNFNDRLPENEVFFQTIVSTAGEYTQYINGDFKETLAGEYNAGNDYTLCAPNDSGEYGRRMAGYLFEIIAFNRKLSANELALMHGYLKGKYSKRPARQPSESSSPIFNLNANDLNGSLASGDSVISWVDSVAGFGIESGIGPAPVLRKNVTTTSGSSVYFDSTQVRYLPYQISATSPYSIFFVSSNVGGGGRSISTNSSENWLMGTWNNEAACCHLNTWVYGTNVGDPLVVIDGKIRVHALTVQDIPPNAGLTTASYYVSGIVKKANMDVSATTVPKALSLGGNGNNTECAVCHIHQLIIYDRCLTSGEVYTVSTGLMNTWGERL